MAALKKQTSVSNITLYGIGVGLLMLGGTVVSLKNTLFPPPLAPCLGLDWLLPCWSGFGPAEVRCGCSSGWSA